MKSLLSIYACDFKLSLEAGVIDREEIIRWADEILIAEDYDDRLAEISLVSNKSNKDLEVLLGEIAGSDPDWDGFRRMLGRIHCALISDPTRLHEFTRFLERLWIRFGYTLPEDLNFIIGIEDDCLIAEDGGSVDEIRCQLLECLALYRNTSPE